MNTVLDKIREGIFKFFYVLYNYKLNSFQAIDHFIYFHTYADQ